MPKVPVTYLTAAQAAALLGISPYTLRREVSLGRVAAHRPSPHTLRIALAEVERLLRPVQPAPGADVEGQDEQ